MTEGTDLKPVTAIDTYFTPTDDGFKIEGKTDPFMNQSEQFSYVVTSASFTIQQFYAKQEVLRVNPVASLYVENKGQLTPKG